MKIKSGCGLILSSYLVLITFTLLGGFGLFDGQSDVNKAIVIILTTLYAGLLAFMTYLVKAWKQSYKKLLLSGVTIVLMLALLEIGVRTFHPAHGIATYKMYYSPELHHMSPPGSKMIFESTSRGPADIGSQLITVETNELGLRSHYTRDEFLSYGKRIVVLGDSFVFGLYVRERDAFPTRLESLLRASSEGEDLAVLNAGMISYSPFLERILLETQLKTWQPDLVILTLDATDFGDDIQYALDYDPAGNPPFPRKAFLNLLDSGPALTDHSAVIQRLYFPFLFLRGFLTHPILMATADISPSALEIEIGTTIERNNFFIYRHPLAATETYLRETLGNIQQVAQVAESAGARFLLVVAPRFHHWNPKECPNNWEADQYELDEPFQYEYLRFFEEVQAEVDFPILNLLTAFESSDHFPLVFDDDPHWNAAGHDLVARAIAEELAKLTTAKNSSSSS